MKKVSFIILFMVFYLYSDSQELIHKTIFSQAMNDSMKFDIWLPRYWNENGHYPTIYLNSYGALAGVNDMLVAAHINNFINGFPPSVVVAIRSSKLRQMSQMDYSYQTGQVGKTGLQFVEFLKNELIPKIELAYKTTRFRAFIGHSYSASYANYLFLKQPGLFNAYILLTPEKIREDQPPFYIDDTLKNYYNNHPTMYYIAPAGKDEKRRQDYAKEIASKVKISDSNNFHFEYHLFTDADHNNILDYGLLPGLKFIFSLAPYSAPNKEMNMEKWIDIMITNRKNIYGLESDINSDMQAPLLNFINNKKDEKSLDFLAKYFSDTLNDDIAYMLFNTASSYVEFENYSKAVDYFKKSILEAKKHHNPDILDNGYFILAYNIYWKHDKNIKAAWETLLQAFDDTKHYAYKYLLGQISAEEKFKPEEGIKFLQEFIKFRTNTPPDFNYSISDAYLQIAKCYYNKKDKLDLKLYLDKALKENPNNKEALKWKQDIKL